MANGYKIRLADGSEIGPMDREAVRAWYTQGLATRETLVLTPGSKRWTTLAEAVELKDLRAPSQRIEPPATRPSRSAPPERLVYSEEEPQTWRTRLVAALFALFALGSVLLALYPERWTPSLDGTPWLLIALGCVIMAALLHRGAELPRKIASVAVFLLSLGGFVLLGLLVAQGLRGRPLYVVVSAIVLFGGFFALLAGGIHAWPRIALSALALTAGLAGIVAFGVVPGNPLSDDILAWAAPERRYADEGLGVALELPPGWVALRQEQTIVSLPEEARVAFGNSRREGLGFLVIESAPKGVISLDHYLEHVLRERRKAHSTFEETARGEVSFSAVVGRKVSSTWEEDGRRFVEVATVARDGWTYVALAAWMPSGTAVAAGRELEAVPARLSLSGVLAERLQDAVKTATREVPYLTATAAEMVMGQSAALALDPEVTFRRAYRFASAGTRSLDRSEFAELGQLNAAVYSSLSRGDRERLAAYFDRVRADVPGSPQEDRDMLRVMTNGVRKLSPPQLSRLQQIYEKAIRVAILRE
jgi:hypothetical protein